MLNFKNNKLEKQININDFFHYSSDRFSEVWQTYKQVVEKSLPAKNIARELSGLFYPDQLIDDNGEYSVSGLTQNQIKELIDSGGYHIETAPLLHPAFSNTIATLLDVTENELRGILSYDFKLSGKTVIKRSVSEDSEYSGPGTIQNLLKANKKINVNGVDMDPAQLLITKIPILPLKQRPFLPGLINKSYPGVDNISYFMISRLADHLLVQDDISTVTDIHAFRLLQRYFIELIFAVENKFANNKWAVLDKINELNSVKPQPGQTGTDPDGAGIPIYRNSYDNEEKNIPLDIISINDTGICVQYPQRTILYDTSSSAETMSVAVKNFKIHKIDLAKKFIRFFGCRDSDKQQPGDFMQYHYQEKEWKPEVLVDDSFIELAHYTERLVLVNYRNDSETLLPQLADPPAKKIHSTCGKYILIEDKHGNGGIYNIAAGLSVISSEDIHRLTGDDIPVYEIQKPGDGMYSVEMLEASRRKNRFELGALVVHESSCTLLYQDILYHNGKPVFEIKYPYSCAAFDKRGKSLLLLSGIDLLVIDIDRYLTLADLKYQLLTLKNNS